MTRAPAILRDESGASLIEMGLAAPLLAAFLVGMVDVAGAFSAKLNVEQAAQRTIEMVQRSGFVKAQKATLKAEAENAAGTGSTATVEAWLECNGVRATDYDDPCSVKPAVRQVSVTISKNYKPYFKLPWGGNANGTYTVRGHAGIRVQ